MKTGCTDHLRRDRRGFTLIELIGVITIVAIMASIIAPNALRSIERETIRAEDETAARIGGQLQLYLRDTGALPPLATWTTALAAYSDLAATDLQTNKRANNRLLVYDTASTPNPRALLLSSMRQGLNLPGAAAVRANFQTIWDTADDQIPSTLNWAGWAAVASSGDFLVVERINLRLIYLVELQNFTVALKNNGTGTVSYRITRANGAVATAVNVAPGVTTSLTSLHPNDRVDLYRASGGATLDYTCVLSTTGKNFDYDGAKWVQK